jgi:murein DD-endopeptidase MepM/ murein hydrolase activator NlpD
VIRFVALSCCALALASCASTPSPTYPYRPLTSPPPSGPTIFSTAPRAPLQSELFACHGGGGANIGPIGERGESKLYTPYIYTPAGALLRDPTASACLSSGFGWRETADGGGHEHTGIDLANADGGFVFAAADGWVSSAEWRGGYGLVLELDHGHGVRTLYAHLSEVDPALRGGMFVGAGVAIARMGATGNATGVHLHYELSVDGLKVDPLSYGPSPPTVG